MMLLTAAMWCGDVINSWLDHKLPLTGPFWNIGYTL